MARGRQAPQRVRAFKMEAKGFFLTYPQAENIELEALFKFFTEEYEHPASGKKPNKCIVARELHQDGAPHFHVWIQFQTQVSILRADAFDYNGHHCNIQKERSEKAIQQYITKDGNFLKTANIKIKVPLPELKEILESCPTIDEFRLKCAELGHVIIRSWGNYNKFAEWYYRDRHIIEESKVSEPHFQLDTFKNIPDKVLEFIETVRARQPGSSRRVRSLWIYGDSKLGKTALAKSIGKFVSIANSWNAESLDFEKKAQYILLDDLPWTSFEWQYKALLGCQTDVTFTGKYFKPRVCPFGIPAIVLSNTLPEFTAEQLRWMERNIDFIEITEPLSDIAESL